MRPLFFVPEGASTPGATDATTFRTHLEIAQARYEELLGATFALESDPETVPGALTLAEYAVLPESGVPAITAELLERDGVSRWSNPSIYAVVLMDPAYYAGGRTVNGGFQGGGGVTVLSHGAFVAANFQSTLQHELGHTFGLPHVDVYGDSMSDSVSMMSYDEDHWTSGFDPSPTPGAFLREDRRGLSWNERALPGVAFAGRDEPLLAGLRPPVCLGPMDLPGLPSNGIGVTTPSGELFGSAVANVVQGTRIHPDEGPFDASAMWQSDTAADGWVSVDLVFPTEVTLDRITVHTQHSGLYNAADAATVERAKGGDHAEVGSWDSLTPDAILRFAPHTSDTWRVRLHAAETQVTVRGLRFFDEGREIFPFCVPYGG